MKAMQKLFLTMPLFIVAFIVSNTSRHQIWAETEEKITPQQKFENFQKETVEDLIGNLERNPGDLATIHRLRELGDPTAIAPLKKAFERNNGKPEKQATAASLLRLGEADPVYFDYLIQYAKPAIESDRPYPLAFDSSGKVIKGKLSEDFLKWCKEKQVDPNVEAGHVLFSLPTDVKFLALAADPRAVTLLMQGLKSKNYSIIARSAEGLAILKEKRAIKLIIEACINAPAEAASMIAPALVFFEDPKAQEAAERFIQDKQLLEFLRKRAEEKGPEGVFG